MTLRKKQDIKDNREWIEAFNDCLKVVSFERIKEIEAKTIEAIRRVSKGYTKICSGWIAGKDSIVLNSILEKSGIDFTPIMWRGVNEWECMKEWISNNKPNNIIFEIIDKFDFPFLEKHPDYLFCRGNTRQPLMAEKWKRQNSDIRKHGFDLFVVGRRIKDGNQCGSKKSEFIVKKQGYDVFAPLAEWTHEEMLAYIKYNNIELPPFYSFPRGFLIGSIAMGEWTEYAALNKTETEVWDEIYSIEPDTVINAAKHLTAAKKYLETRYKNEN